MSRIFFATDIHGSEICWRKFLNAGEHYGVDAVILGGDMTGKAMIPVVHEGGVWRAESEGRELEASSEEELEQLERRIADRGYYPARMEPDRAAALAEDPKLVDELFKQRMLETMERWMEIAAEKLGRSGHRCIVCPGNDDMLDIDEVIDSSEAVENGENAVLELDGFTVGSTGWTNPTPWDTYRESSDEELRTRIDQIVAQLPDPDHAVFNFHPPPYDSGLDQAPDLDEELRPKQGGRAMEPVGSRAVRDVIEEFQPLASLHGHVHESRGAVRLGRTLSINPGSAYDEGVLQGALLELNAKKGKVRNYTLVEG